MIKWLKKLHFHRWEEIYDSAMEAFKRGNKRCPVGGYTIDKCSICNKERTIRWSVF